MKEFYIDCDGIKLHAKLDRVNETGKSPLCILVHGFTGHMEEDHIVAAQKAINECGISVLRVEMYGEITDNERKALLAYESYVKERMDMEQMPDVRPVTGKPRVVSLTCKRCSAVLEVNANLTTAFCPYCGTKHIIYQENK